MRKSISLMIALLTSTAGLSAAQPTSSFMFDSNGQVSDRFLVACLVGEVVTIIGIYVSLVLKEAFIASRTKARIAEIASLYRGTHLKYFEETLPNGQKVLLRREDCFNVCYIDGYKVDTRAFLEEGKIVHPRYPRYR